MVGYMWIYTLKTWILEETCRVIEISLENMESKICENMVTTFSPPIRVLTSERSILHSEKIKINYVRMDHEA